MVNGGAMTFLKTLVTCWREILLLVLVGLGIGYASDLVSTFGVTHGDITGLAFLDRTMKGLSTFASVMCTGGILGIFLWPSLAHWGNEFFVGTFQSLDGKYKLLLYVGTTMFACLIAAICFTAK
jgi:hypothetical protein